MWLMCGGEGPKVASSVEEEGSTFSKQWQNELLTLILSLMNLVVCQSHILNQRMSPSLKRQVWRERAENNVFVKDGCVNLTGWSISETQIP